MFFCFFIVFSYCLALYSFISSCINKFSLTYTFVAVFFHIMFSLYRGLLLGDIGLVSANQMDIFDFSVICERVPFSICPALGITDSTCFARNVSIGPWLLFQPGKACLFLRRLNRFLFCCVQLLLLLISVLSL